MLPKRCQLDHLTEISFIENLAKYLKVKYILARMKKAIIQPDFLVQKLKTLLNGKTGRKSRPAADEPALAPGEMVRIKSLEDIEKTLDKDGKFEGVYFMKDAMAGYCGGVYKVRKRIVQFFDERTGRIRRPRNVVILDGVFCEAQSVCSSDLGNCDRTCFLFWKEAWLEKPKLDDR